jgi:hypothetical protein
LQNGVVNLVQADSLLATPPKEKSDTTLLIQPKHNVVLKDI